MPDTSNAPATADTLMTAAFIERWRGVSASELSTAQSFVIGLCDWLGVPPPHATPEQDYLFERPVTFLHGNGSTSAGRIDCDERGLVSLLRTLHDELDAAVLQAYGWHDLSQVPWGNAPAQQAWTDALLTRLVALNAQRAAQEAQGNIRWLRPTFQDPALRQQQAEMLLNKELLAHVNKGLEGDFPYKSGEAPTLADSSAASGTPTGLNVKSGVTAHQTKALSGPPQTWPATLPEQVKAVAQLLADAQQPLTLAHIEAAFKGRGAWKKPCPPCLKHWSRWAGRSSAMQRALPPGAMPEAAASMRTRKLAAKRDHHD